MNFLQHKRQRWGKAPNSNSKTRLRGVSMRPRPDDAPAFTHIADMHEKGHSGPELLAWAVITQAVYDVQALRRCGVMGPEGELPASWPTTRYFHTPSQRYYNREAKYEGINSLRQCLDLRDFFTGGQLDRWLELVNSPLTAAELWRRALDVKEEA